MNNKNESVIHAAAGPKLVLACLSLLTPMCARQCLAQAKPGDPGSLVSFGFNSFAVAGLFSVEFDLMEGKIADAVAGLERAGEKGNGDGWAEQIADGLFLLGKPKEARIYAERYRKSTPAYAYIPYLQVLYGCSHGVVDKPALSQTRRVLIKGLEGSYGSVFVAGGNVQRQVSDLLPKGDGIKVAEFIAYLAGSHSNLGNNFRFLLLKKAVSIEPRNMFANSELGSEYTAYARFKTGIRYLELSLTEDPGRLASSIKVSLAEALKFARKEQPTPSP